VWPTGRHHPCLFHSSLCLSSCFLSAKSSEHQRDDILIWPRSIYLIASQRSKSN
jgi:hypothetical protein